jgi:fatty aldehyde-generating acyl-ACP reductase
MIPFLSRVPPWFTFAVHPRDAQDLLRTDAGRFLMHYCRNIAELESRMCSMSPCVIGEIFIRSSAIRGEIIAVACMPNEMMGKRGRESVRAAAILAQRRGARVFGLGALTSPATLGGRWLLDASSTLIITNGNAFTAAVIRQNVSEAVSFLSLRRPAAVAIVGCTGSVGFVLCQLLAQLGHRLFLVGRNPAAVKKRFTTLPLRSEVRELGSATFDAEVVVLLTHDPAAQMRTENLRRGTIVIDCAQPPNVTACTRAELSRSGVFVTEGGLVTIPGYESTYDFGLSTCGATFACLAETFLFARAGYRVHSVGDPTKTMVEDLDLLAARHGIRAVSLFETNKHFMASDAPNVVIPRKRSDVTVQSDFSRVV